MVSPPQSETQPAPILIDEPPLRLSIGHLMLWTLATAVLLALNLPTTEQSFEGRQSWSMVLRFYRAIFAVIYGPAVGSLILWLSWIIGRGPPFPRHAGHWILLNMGASALIGSAIFGLRARLGMVLNLQSHALILATLQIVFITLAAVTLIKMREAFRWRVLFILKIVASVILIGILVPICLEANGSWARLLMSLSSLIDIIFQLAVVVAVLVAVSLDRRFRAARDYLHWTGVFLVFAGLASRILQSVLPMLAVWLDRSNPI